jgi:hypothetical protein
MNRRTAVIGSAVAATLVLIGGVLYVRQHPHNIRSTAGPAASVSGVTPTDSVDPPPTLPSNDPATIDRAITPESCSTPATLAGAKMLAVFDVYASGGAISKEHLQISPPACAEPWQTLEAGNLLSANCQLPFPWTAGTYRDATLSKLGVADMQRVEIDGENDQSVNETLLGFRDSNGIKTLSESAHLCGGKLASGRTVIPADKGTIVMHALRPDLLVAIQFTNTKVSHDKVVSKAESLLAH